MLFRSRDNLRANPVIIQGHEIEVCESDTYLGVKITQAGVADSIRQTFEERKQKAWSKVFAFKKMLRHPAMQRNGYIKSAVALFRAVIIPTLLYSSECWFGVSAGMVKLVEKTYKKMIYSLLDIPVTTKYFAILRELGLKQARHIISAQKLNFINSIASNGCDSMVVRVLNEDHRVLGSKSILSEISELSEYYGLPDIWDNPILSDTIKAKVDECNSMQLMKGCLLSPVTVNRVNLRPSFLPYHQWPRSDGRATLLWRCGALKFKDNWRKYYKKKNVDSSCPHPLCPAPDSFEHAVRCLFMNTRLKREEECNNQDERFSRYVVALNHERTTRFCAPIM